MYIFIYDIDFGITFKSRTKKMKPRSMRLTGKVKRLPKSKSSRKRISVDKIRGGEEDNVLVSLIQRRHESVHKTLKNYLLLSRFIFKDGDKNYGGTSFNQLMVTEPIGNKYKIRCNDNILIDLASFHSLNEREWIDDAVIQIYFQLLQNRDDALCNLYKNRKASYFLEPFFFLQLLGTVRGVKIEQNAPDYTERYNFFELPPYYFDNLKKAKRIYVPINVDGNHWIMAVIHVQFFSVVIYDSLYHAGRKNNYSDKLLRFGKYLIRWYSDAVTFITGDRIDNNQWQCNMYEGNIQQDNGYDCGVYVMMTADFMSDNLLLDEMQSNFAVTEFPIMQKFFGFSFDLNPFRIKIGYDIMRGKLDYPLYSYDPNNL